MSETASGLLLCIAAGVASGSFALPMKLAHGWAWENIWFVWTILALLVLPATVSLVTIPHLLGVYAEAGIGPVVTVVVFGLGWGIAQALFGLAVDAIGMALAFAIVPAMSAVLGSAIPLFGWHADEILSKRGVWTLAGIALIIVGMTVCAIAGRRREARQHADGNDHGGRYGRGLALAIGSGLGSAMINLALAFGAPVIDIALRHGATPLWAANSIWLPLMMAGAVPNLAYCAHLMRRNKTTLHFTAAGTDVNWLYAAIMAGFWFGSITIYALASSRLGDWGVILGWPVFTALIVVTAGGLGIAVGEWNGAGVRSLRLQICGMSMLVVAVFVLSAATGPT